jgi:hypothetical protein
MIRLGNSLTLRSVSLALSALALVSTATVSLRAQGIFTANSLDGALTTARERGTIVVISIVMPGERGSDSMLDGHFADGQVKKLAAETVNLQLTVGGESAPPEDEALVRQRYLKVEPTDAVAAPHHLFVDPGEAGTEGTLISSFAYEVSIGQLEWAWADAIKKKRPDFEFALSERAHAPGTLLYGGAGGEGSMPKPGKDEVLAAIKELKAGGWDFQAIVRNYRIVLASDEPKALEYGQQEMRNLPGGFRVGVLTTVGLVSPKEWHSFAASFLEDRDAKLREEAARTLEALNEPKAMKPTRKQYDREKEIAVKGRLLRTIAALGPADKAVMKEIEKILTKDKSPELRVQAAAAITMMEDRATARRLLERALADTTKNVKIAAIYAAAHRRDDEMRPVLEKAKTGEKDIAVTQWIATAIDVIGGGDIAPFAPFVKDVLGDRTRAQVAQQLRDGMTRGRNRNRDQEPEGDGDGEGQAGDGKVGEGAGKAPGRPGEGKGRGTGRGN